MIENKKFYQISAIDHHSSWRLIRAYDDHGLTNVLRFLHELYESAPLAILQIQTDNAAEFTDKYTVWKGGTPLGYHAFDKWCSARGIEHKLIPLGEKEINGKLKTPIASMIGGSTPGTTSQQAKNSNDSSAFIVTTGTINEPPNA